MGVTEGQIEVFPGVRYYLGSQDAPVEFGPSSYWVEIEALDARTYSLRSTGADDVTPVRLELVVGKKPTGFFQFAAFGADGVVLDSNAFIDSYDSSLGSYDSQVQGGNDWAGEKGNVGSNGDIELKANTEIHGDVKPGPGGTLDDSAPNTFVSGSTEPADEPVDMPPIDVPVVASSGSISTGSSATIGPGTVHYDSILVNGGGTLTVVGPAVVVVDDFELKSNSALVFDTANGPVQVYGTGDFVLKSNSDVITPSDSALDVTLFLSADNSPPGAAHQVELSSNSDFVGAIYAPNATFSLGSNFDVYGSIMCGFLDLSSHGQIHFDEALLYDGFGASGEVEALLWRRLPLLTSGLAP
jgi:hypothetical protein